MDVSTRCSTSRSARCNRSAMASRRPPITCCSPVVSSRGRSPIARARSAVAISSTRATRVASVDRDRGEIDRARLCGRHRRGSSAQ
jgi:hypothetical protein